MKYFVRAFLVIGILFSLNCGFYDAEKNYEVANQLSREGKFNEAIMILKNAERKCKDSLKYKVELKLAQNYYFMKEFKSPENICKKLIDSIPDSIDPTIKLGAQMVSLSIERETKGYENLLNFDKEKEKRKVQNKKTGE